MKEFERFEYIFKNAFDTLVGTNHKDLSEIIGVANFVLEYNTMGVVCQRQAGKTSFIREHLTDGDLLIVPNLRMKRDYLSYNPGKGIHILSKKELIRNKSEEPAKRETAYPMVYFDEVHPTEIDFNALVEHGYIDQKTKVFFLTSVWL